MKEMKFGEMRRKAFQYDDFRKKLTEIIRLYRNKLELIENSELKTSSFYYKLKYISFRDDELVKIFRTIIESENYKKVKGDPD